MCLWGQVYGGHWHLCLYVCTSVGTIMHLYIYLYVCPYVDTSVCMSVICLWIWSCVCVSIHALRRHLCICHASVFPYLYPQQNLRHLYVYKGMPNTCTVIKSSRGGTYTGLSSQGIPNISLLYRYGLLSHKQFHYSGFF